jgi:putative flippase GtrA
MSVFRRWLKFSVVGAAGLAVQLVALWLLTRVAAVPAMMAIVIAVETALLHNFIWHELWTWKGIGSASGSTRWARLLRFHTVTGFVSLASNVIFTVLIRNWFGAPLLAANVIAVGMTAILNFVLADRWVFRTLPPVLSHR